MENKHLKNLFLEEKKKTNGELSITFTTNINNNEIFLKINI